MMVAESTECIESLTIIQVSDVGKVCFAKTAYTYPYGVQRCGNGGVVADLKSAESVFSGQSDRL